MSALYQLPRSFDAERVAVFRNYFLEYVYPPPEDRQVLDDAFAQLDGYLESPTKLLQILADSTRLLFKYGRHLPKILQAGIRALQSFRAAATFEQQLVSQAANAGAEPPYSRTDMIGFLKALDTDDVDDFIAASQQLLSTLHDRPLVAKIIDIVDQLIVRMEAKPQVYGEAEIKGLSLGRDLIAAGNHLFDQLNTKEQSMIFDFVIMVERDFLTRIFEE